MSEVLVKIAHISDPHFGTTSFEKIAALTQTLKQLSPDLVLLSGDVTQRARRSQFLAARRFCEGLLPIETTAVPGNHDIPLFNIFARFFWPYFGYRRIFGGSLQNKKRMGPLSVVSLNSTHPLRHVDGELSASSLARLEDFSDDSLFRVVMLHHPLDCAEAVDEKNLLHGASEAMRRFEAGKVDLILTGHIHDPLVRLSHHRYPDSLRPCVLTIAGTCLSSRTRPGAPNSFNFLQISLKENSKVDLVITRYDLSSTCRYEPLIISRFQRRDRDQWIMLE